MFQLTTSTVLHRAACLQLLLVAPRVAVSAPEEAIVLFDGRGTNLFVGAEGGKPNWPVVDGGLASTPNSRRSNNLVSKWHFRDAKIHLEFCQPPEGDGNSGVFLHGVYELQILRHDLSLVPNKSMLGAVYGLHAPKQDAGLPAGKWQTLEIDFKAPRWLVDGKVRIPGAISVWLNGTQIHKAAPLAEKFSEYHPYEYDVTDYLKRVAGHQWRTGIGPLMLQDHDAPVRFRNIWLLPLDEKARLVEIKDASQSLPTEGESTERGDRLE